jgi:hypothetical protein
MPTADPTLSSVFRVYPTLPGIGRDAPNIVGWNDIEVSPVCIVIDADRVALQVFEDEIIDRLFVLHEIRAKEDERQTKTAGGVKKASKRKTERNPNQGTLL